MTAGRTSISERLATARRGRRIAAARQGEEAIRTEETLQQQAEQYLGSQITPSEWDGARAYAEHKLERIIEREGDADGARREPWYLAQLIAEAVKGNRFSKLTQDLWEAYRYIEQMGIKKGQPTP